MSQYTVDFYKTPSGACPVQDFLDSVDTKMRAKLLRSVLLLEQNGNDLREPYSKSLGGGIFELRAIQGNDITRVLYFFLKGNTIVLTNDFQKKSQKTPLSAIQTAKRYRKDYLQRKESL